MTSPDWQEWLKQAEQLLFNQKKIAEASSLAERILQVQPNCAPALQVLGLALSESGRPHEAIARLSKAVTLQPDLARAHSALGLSYSHLGDLDQALHHLNVCLYLQPDYSFAHLIRALVWLRQGQFKPGWIEFEWRFVCGLVQKPKIPRPRWDGSPLQGRSILVDTEQGAGDVFQFIRFLPMLRSQGARIVLVVTQPQVHALIRPLPYYDEWLPVGETGPIRFDLYCPLLSLPGILGIDEATIPRTTPYLFAEPERLQRWRPRIEALPGLKVGLCWQGNPSFPGDHFRSIPLERFASLSRVPGVTFVSLQKGHGEEQIESNRQRFALQVLPDMDREAAFVDTAAVMQHLDLIITVDTAIAHLAGALGRPVWVLLSTSSDWRWLDKRADSPWYPTMRLFRQKSLGNWHEVFREVADALRQEAAPKATAQATSILHVPVSAGELLDKIAILQIKQERIVDEAKRANVRRELELLLPARQESIPDSPELAMLTVALRAVNEELWDFEEQIRECERASDFGERFISLARSIYQTNDRRVQLKRQINELLHSPIMEEKSFHGKS